MKEQKKYNLKKAIDQLPAYKAPDKIWGNIAKRMDNMNAPLQRAIQDLPVFKVPEKIWNTIEEGLEKEGGKKVFLFQKQVIRIAASIIVLLAIGYLVKYFIVPPDKDLIYSVEIVEDDTGIDFMPTVDTGSSDIILSNCKKNPEVCESPLFIELENQLKELKAEQEKLQKILKGNPDPQLIKFLYRMENDRVEIEKKIIKMFIES
ncbi:MAG: hypothetical protein JXB17_10385 [Bacteroidales bacterium]|nr:hypothetical protein [Bacteroidales bacterium]